MTEDVRELREIKKSLKQLLEANKESQMKIDDRLERIAILQAALVAGRSSDVGRLAKIVGIGKADLINKLGKERGKAKGRKKNAKQTKPNQEDKEH